MIDNSMTRRGFLVGAGAIGTAAAIGATGCTPESNTAAESESAPTASDWLGTEPEISEEDVVEVVDTEVLVVGAGVGGTFAASFAAQEGAKTILIEKGESGVGIRSSALGAVDSTWQRSQGVEIDHADILADIADRSLGYGNLRRWSYWVENSAEALDWYHEIIEPGGFTFFLEWSMPEGTRHPYWPTGHGTSKIDNPREGDQDATHKLVLDRFVENGGEYRTLTTMIKLIKEDGKVVGAYAESNDGIIRFNASKGVVIACGGYVNNPEMYLARQGELSKSITGTMNFGCIDGSGIKAMCWAGAQMESIPTSMIFDRGVVKPDADITENEFNGPSDYKFFVFATQPFLKVNVDGKRITNESSPYDYIMHCANAQGNRTWYPIWDSTWEEDVIRFHTCGCSTLGQKEGGNEKAPTYEEVRGQMESLVADGYIIKADTLEELADGLMINKENFLLEVEKYNEYFANGKDEQFGKDAFRLSSIDTPPYYGMRTGGMALCTLDGVETDDDFRVLDENLQPIPGLYAVGNDAGGWYALTYPNQAAGINAGRTATCGMLLGKALAEA